MSGVDRQELHDLLIRIDERVRTIQEDIRSINSQRKCPEHTEKIRTLERLVWGCCASMLGVAVRMAYEVLR